MSGDLFKKFVEETTKTQVSEIKEAVNGMKFVYDTMIASGFSESQAWEFLMRGIYNNEG